MKKEYRRKSLGHMIFILFMLSAIVFDAVIVGVSYVMYTRNMNEEGERISTGIAQTVAAGINPNHISSWVEKKKNDGYTDTEEKLESLMMSFSDLRNISVCKMHSDRMLTIYDVGYETMENKNFGVLVKYDKRTESVKESLINNRPVSAVFTNNGAEDTVIAYAPVKDSKNNVVCYVITEISMAEMIRNRDKFVVTLFLAMLAVIVILLTLANIYMGRILVVPIKLIDKRLRKVALDNSKGDETIEGLTKVKNYNIKEIESLKNNFIDLVQDVSIKSHEVREFDTTIMERMKDALGEDNIVSGDEMAEDE